MSVLPPTPTLDETIATGQHGHITDHEEIHRILNDLIDVIADPGPTIYIDATNGDDANDGKSVGTPKLTWAAALAALDDGTTIQGRIVAIGRFTITAPIVIGDGSKYVNLILDGFEAYSGSNSGLGACRITQSTNNTDIFQFAAPTSKSHSLIVRGIEVVGPGATSTGTAFNFAPGAQWVAAKIQNCQARSIGTGFKIGGSIHFLGDSVSAISCDVGYDFVSSVADGAQPNMATLRRFHAQSCTTAGLRISAATREPLFDGVIQANNGPGVLISAGMRAPRFRIWFEFPGDDMVRITGTSGGLGPLDNAVFEGCNFDGSGNNRNAFRVTAAAASSVFLKGITFLGGTFQNHGTGKFVAVDNGDPAGATDPGITNATFIGMSGLGSGNIQGAFAVAAAPRALITLLGVDVSAGTAVVTNTAAAVSMVTATGVLRLFNLALTVDGALSAASAAITGTVSAATVSASAAMLWDNGSGRVDFAANAGAGSVRGRTTGGAGTDWQLLNGGSNLQVQTAQASLLLRPANTTTLTLTTTLLTLADAVNIAVGTGTGTSVGSAANQKTGMHGARVIQRAGAAQAAVDTTAATNSSPYGFATAAQADGIVTLLNEIRAVVVEKGIMKGSA